jgi:hypothetical protein
VFIAARAQAVAHVTGTMSADDLRGMHVGDAVRRGKRLALFMPVETDGQCAALP